MKKLLAVLMSLLLFVLCLTGCGGGVDKTKSKPAADENDVVITVWSGQVGPQKIWESMVDEWNAETGDKKDIFIEWETITDSTQLDVAFQNDKLPEIIGLGSDTQKEKIRLAGKLAAINDLPGGDEFLKEYGEPGIEGSNLFDGKQYNVHSTAQSVGLVYNKDLFVQAGIVDENGEAKPPVTVSELKEYAKKISEIDGVYGFAMPLKFSIYWTIDVQTAQYFDLDSPATVIDFDTLTVTCPGYKERYQWILDMKEEGSLFPDAMTLDNDTARAYFSSGIIGMIPSVSWDYAVYTEQFPTDCEWAVCEFPAFEGRPVGRKTTTKSGGHSIAYTALKDEKTAEATMEVYKFIYSVDTRARLFEEGAALSSKNDVMEVADQKKVISQFKQYAELAERDIKGFVSQKYTVEGETFNDLFQKVWMGKISLDDAIKDFETRSTTALRKAVEKGNYDVEKQKEVEKAKREYFEEWKKNK